MTGFAIFFFFFGLNCSSSPLKSSGRAHWGCQTGREQQARLARDARGKMGLINVSLPWPRGSVWGWGSPASAGCLGGQQGFACLSLDVPAEEMPWEEPPLPHPAGAGDRGVKIIHKMFYSSNCK